MLLGAHAWLSKLHINDGNIEHWILQFMNDPPIPRSLSCRIPPPPLPTHTHFSHHLHPPNLLALFPSFVHSAPIPGFCFLSTPPFPLLLSLSTCKPHSVFTVLITHLHSLSNTILLLAFVAYSIHLIIKTPLTYSLSMIAMDSLLTSFRLPGSYPSTFYLYLRCDHLTITPIYEALILMDDPEVVHLQQQFPHVAWQELQPFAFPTGDTVCFPHPAAGAYQCPICHPTAQRPKGKKITKQGIPLSCHHPPSLKLLELKPQHLPSHKLHFTLVQPFPKWTCPIG